LTSNGSGAETGAGGLIGAGAGGTAGHSPVVGVDSADGKVGAVVSGLAIVVAIGTEFATGAALVGGDDAAIGGTCGCWFSTGTPPQDGRSGCATMIGVSMLSGEVGASGDTLDRVTYP
jgi:hypothetical protein